MFCLFVCVPPYCVLKQQHFGLEELALQLDEGKDLAKSVEAIKDANKRGALHFAAREGQTSVCEYLLTDLKLSVDSQDDDGASSPSLSLSVYYIVNTCNLLPDDNCHCFSGETALIHAARQGHTATAKYLIDHGADPTVASNLGATALHHSAGIGPFSPHLTSPLLFFFFFEIDG